MPYGGNDWLALTQEPTLEPELPICDPITIFGTDGCRVCPTNGIFWTSSMPTSLAGTTSGRRCSGGAFDVPSGRAVALRPVGEVEFVQGWRRQVPAGSMTQPRGRRHHRPCRLEARGPGGAGPGGVTAASPNRFRASGITSPGVPTRRWTTGRARDPRQRHLPSRGEGLVRQGVLPGYHDLVSSDARSGRFRPGRTGVTDYSQPHRRTQSGGPVRQPGGRGAHRLASRDRCGGGLSQYHPQTGRPGHAPHGV